MRNFFDAKDLLFLLLIRRSPRCIILADSLVIAAVVIAAVVTAGIAAASELKSCCCCYYLFDINHLNFLKTTPMQVQDHFVLANTLITLITIATKHISLLVSASTQCAELVSTSISARSTDSQHSNTALQLNLNLSNLLILLLLPIQHILLDYALLLRISELLSSPQMWGFF